jgi:hypothetical protein
MPDQPDEMCAWNPDWDQPPADDELYGLCPDPYAGRPACVDDWLAGLSASARNALLDESEEALDSAQRSGQCSGQCQGSGQCARQCAWSGRAPMEAIGAGFTHRQSVPDECAVGFAAGGPLDQLVPDPVLAGFADDAVRDGLRLLCDDELVGLMGAARRLSSWQAATELAAAAELDARRRAAAERPGMSRVSEHVSEELAAALTLTGRAADHLLGVARGLSRLPPVLTALSAGVIDRAKAEVFVAELAALGDIAAKAVAAALWLPARDMTTGQLRMALRAMVLAIDPDAVRRRAAAGRAQARVESWQELSGNGALAGRELPPAEMIAADQRIDAIARSLQAAGAPGNLEQLRAAVFTALLLGRDPAVILLRDQSRAPGNTGGSAGAGGSAGPRGSAGADGSTGPGWMAGLTGSVNLTMPAAAWLGLSDAPGEVAGFGPLDATTCRELADLLAAGRARWCVTLTGPDSRAVAHACDRTGPGVRAGPGGRAGPDGAAWLAGLRFSWLERGDCAHRRQTTAYRPGPGLRHLIEIRQRTCSAPGCRRPARRCDLDHTIPFDQGGRTCECGLAPLCRRHHRAKQAPGWQLDQPEPGVLVWTAPSGRTYPVQPDTYPV